VKILWVGMFVAALASCVSTAHAQSGEVFGGYSYLRSDSGGGYNTSFWEGSLTGNFNRFFGLEVDIGDHYNTPPNSSFRTQTPRLSCSGRTLRFAAVPG